MTAVLKGTTVAVSIPHVLVEFLHSGAVVPGN